MGYFGKLAEKEQARALRQQGLSYNEIRQHIHVSKDTISRWCKDIVLTDAQIQRLIKNKINGQRKGSIIAVTNKKDVRLRQLKELARRSKNDIGKISVRDKFIAGIVLYASEGTKMDGKGAFTNSDSRLLKFMKQWFVEFAKIDPGKLRCRLWLREDLDEKKAKDFWAKELVLPKNQFIKTYIVKSRKNTKVTKNLHKYGICALVFYDTSAHRRIMSWISALFGDKIEQYSAIAQR